jgi:hypothetical protein
MGTVGANDYSPVPNDYSPVPNDYSPVDWAIDFGQLIFGQLIIGQLIIGQLIIGRLKIFRPYNFDDAVNMVGHNNMTM